MGVSEKGVWRPAKAKVLVPGVSDTIHQPASYLTKGPCPARPVTTSRVQQRDIEVFWEDFQRTGKGALAGLVTTTDPLTFRSSVQLRHTAFQGDEEPDWDVGKARPRFRAVEREVRAGSPVGRVTATRLQSMRSQTLSRQGFRTEAATGASSGSSSSQSPWGNTAADSLTGPLTGPGTQSAGPSDFASWQPTTRRPQTMPCGQRHETKPSWQTAQRRLDFMGSGQMDTVDYSMRRIGDGLRAPMQSPPRSAQAQPSQKLKLAFSNRQGHVVRGVTRQ